MYGEVWGEALDKGWHLPILDRVSPTYYRVAPSMTEWHLPILDLSQNATHLSKSGTYYRVAPETEWHLLLQSGTYDYRVAPTITEWHLKYSGTYFYRVAPHNNRQSGTPQ